MFAGIFEIDSWMGTERHYFEGESPSDLIDQLEHVQDLSCLVRMGRMEEDKKGQKQIDKLEAFLDKYYSNGLTVEDLRNFNIKISIGWIRCAKVAEGEKAVEELSKEYEDSK